MPGIRAAEVRDSDNEVVNIIVRNPGRPTNGRPGHTLRDDPDGKAQIGGTWDDVGKQFLARPRDPENRTLDEVKSEALFLVDRLAGLERRKYITAAPGQSEVYEQKQSEVRAWEAAQIPGSAPIDLAIVPWMVRRAARLNAVAVADVTEAQAAAVYTEWSGKIAAWRAIGLDIEDVREGAKEQIEAATTADQVGQVLDGLTWPPPA